jgi:hypothetical protein
MEEFQMTLKVRWDDLGSGAVGGGLADCLQEACSLAVYRKYTPPVEADVQWGGKIRGILTILPREQVELEERLQVELLAAVSLVPALREQVAALEAELQQVRQSGQQLVPGHKDGKDL